MQIILQFREPLVIRLLQTILFVFIFTHAFSQSTSDISLEKEAAAILERNISLQWKGGSLPELLKELSAKENINIAYSPEKIKFIIIKSEFFNNEKLSSLLSKIFFNTGYTYLVIGKTIAIVQEKKAPVASPGIVPYSPHADSAAHKIPQKSFSHIYPDTSGVTRLPYPIRRKLRRIYRQELSFARKHQKDSTDQNKASDTQKKRSPVNSSYFKPTIFVSANAGPSTVVERFTSDFSHWKNQLDFKSKTHLTLCPGINGGILFRSFIAESGIRYAKISIDNSYTEDPKTLKVKKFSETYSVFTIPVNVLYYRKIKRVILGGGPGIGISFIKTTALKDPMRPYYDRIKGALKEEYSESYRRVSPEINLKAFAGYQVTEQWSVSGNILFSMPILAYYENSVFRQYPCFAGAQVAVSYYFTVKR